MIKKILNIFKKRQYTSVEQRKIIESDLKKELDDREKKASYKCHKYRRKTLEIQILRELLEEDDRLYTETEINALFKSIAIEAQKL